MEITIFLERRNYMSFNCVFMNKEFAVIGSDSRESFEDGTYNDNRQKTFWNNEQKLCWSITGLLSINNINCVDIINDVMNMKASIIGKLKLIEVIMSHLTLEYYKQYDKNIIFDMMVVQNNGEELVLYVLEVINGKANIAVNKKYHQTQNEEVCIASGVHVDSKNEINLNKMKKNPIEEMRRVVNIAIKSSEESDKTVGGTPTIVLIKKDAEIISF